MKNKLFLISLVCVILISACGPSGKDEAPVGVEEQSVESESSQPEPTTAPEPTAYVCPIQEKQHEDWETVYCDTFDENLYGWELGIDYENGLETDIKNGKLILDFNPENQSGYSTGFSLANPIYGAENYVLNILGEMKSKFKNCTWGVLVNGYYDTGVAFDIDNQGNFYVTDYGYSGDIYIGNADSGSNSAIKWDAPNTITVLAEGGKFLFFVNDTMLASYEPSDTDKVNVSLSSWAAEGVLVTYEIDHILVREK
jgi:hypothetical protein